MQAIIPALIQNAYNIFGTGTDSLQATAVYLAKTLNKSYKESWSVIITISVNYDNNLGNVMLNENGTWWSIWGVKYSQRLFWTYYLSKIAENNSNYLVGPPSTNSSGFDDKQVNSLQKLLNQCKYDTNLTQSANKISILSSTIVTDCKFNVLYISCCVSPYYYDIYASYNPIKENRYVAGYVNENNGTIKIKYLLTCI